MRKVFLYFGIVAVFCLTATVTATASETVHHDLQVRLQPATHSLQVSDSLSLDGAVAADQDGAYRFVIHAGLDPRVETQGWSLERLSGPVAAGFFGINATTETVPDNVPLESFRLVPDEGPAGRWSCPTAERSSTTRWQPQGEEYQRSFSETPGIIDDDGVFLAGTSFWVPTFGDGLMTFDLTVEGLEPPWDVVSQGRRSAHETDSGGSVTTAWQLEHPTEEIYLVAGPWHEYSRTAGEVEVFAFLREDDPALAQRYLDATARYLELYNNMLPAYPYASFALVENFWETGYGMPGFTLLGPRVIRFPWILTSSYPHELLHNWWGNSVYVDFATGNWCEGLTAYMADHLFAEQRGEGADLPPRHPQEVPRLRVGRRRLPADRVRLAPLRGLRGGRLRQEPDALPHAAPRGRRRGLPRGALAPSIASTASPAPPSPTSRRPSPRRPAVTGRPLFEEWVEAHRRAPRSRSSRRAPNRVLRARRRGGCRSTFGRSRMTTPTRFRSR